MDARTRSNSRRAARNWSARLSALLGLLSVATLPAAVAASRATEAISLLQAGFAVPLAAALALLALWTARRGRRRAERTVGRAGGRGLARTGRILGLLGLYLAVTAALALGVYALLTYSAS